MGRRKSLEEILWLGQRYIRTSNGEEVNPVPIGLPSIITYTGKSSPQPDAKLIAEQAKKEGLLDMVNAYCRNDTLHYFSVVTVKVASVQFYRI